MDADERRAYHGPGDHEITGFRYISNSLGQAIVFIHPTWRRALLGGPDLRGRRGVGAMSTARADVEDAFAALARHRTDIEATPMAAMFDDDPARFERFSLRLDDLLFDFSKKIGRASGRESV